MKASFLPTTTYGVPKVYEAGWPTPPSFFEPELGQRMMEVYWIQECGQGKGGK
jgi:hypothetical protein